MMKLWRRLCFLVLAVSFISRGQTDPSDSKDDQHPKHSNDSYSSALLTTPSRSLNESVSNETIRPSSVPQNHTSPNTTNQPSPALTTQKDSVDTVNTTVESSMPKTTVPASGREEDHVYVTTVSMTMSSRPTLQEPPVETEKPSWVYVILVFIILAIIVLCVILYYLRRVSRTYSFDLQRPSPANHHNEPTGTFEPVYLDDLDRPALKDQVTPDDLSPPPVANGTTQLEEKSSNGEIAPQEQPEANGLEASPTSHTSLSLGDDPAEKTSSSSSSTNLFFEAVGKEQQNENNNNPSVCSSDPFVEINLDDPACCDQLLTSPEAPSSVLPFSPFSFSSSSSSSSSS